jgi:amidase
LIIGAYLEFWIWLLGILCRQRRIRPFLLQRNADSQVLKIAFKINSMKHSAADTGAFIETFTIEPYAKGSLDSLTFAVKDLIDVAGKKTGFGNPRWRETHPEAVATAVCVEQLLSSGARCIGKTITEELAYSLIGENHFYGTPLNCKAPDRVPGGSSSGSASAVACGVVDFALGTDTGGSVRVPASNCGIWGMRPSHDAVSAAGVCALSLSFDTVGVLASSAEILERAMLVLLSSGASSDNQPATIFFLREAFDLCDPVVIAALENPLKQLRMNFGHRVREVSIREIDSADAEGLKNWYEIYRVLQRAEAWNSLGSWIEAERPQLGSMIEESLELARDLDRRLVPAIKDRKEDYYRKMNAFLGPRDVICFPTVCSPAPLKGTVQKRDQAPREYYVRLLSLTSIAGVARLPQISMPFGEVAGAPVGLSVLGRFQEDAFLLAFAGSASAS